MTVVSDSSPIIALARVNKLHLLENLFGQVVIPDGVEKELTRPGRPGAVEVSLGRIFKLKTVKNQSAVSQLVSSLSQADAEVIVLAREKKDAVILSDDARLLKQALKEGLAALTTRNILLEAKRQGFLASVKETMDEMRRQGIGIPDNIYEDTLKQAGEK